jgi:hypothetical protein
LHLQDGKPISETKRHTFILGFQTAVTTSCLIAEQIFQQFQNSRFILTYKLGQDHIETLFSKIRGKDGCNSNPNSINFKAALRAILASADITASSCANSMDLDDDNGERVSMLLQPKRKNRLTQPETEEDIQQQETDIVERIEMELSKPILDIVQYIGKELPSFMNR